METQHRTASTSPATRRPTAPRQEPLALLIGFVLDQQIPVQKAFSGPLELKRRLGTLEPPRSRPWIRPSSTASSGNDRPSIASPATWRAHAGALCRYRHGLRRRRRARLDGRATARPRAAAARPARHRPDEGADADRDARQAVRGQAARLGGRRAEPSDPRRRRLGRSAGELSGKKRAHKAAMRAAGAKKA